MAPGRRTRNPVTAPPAAWWQRNPAWAGSALVGTVALVIALARALHEPSFTTDFDQFHFAAKALWRGENPYAVIGQGREFEWGWPLNYPLPSVLFVMPLAWLPVVAGRVAFAAAGGALLGYAICRDGFWRLPIMFSAAFMIAVTRTQWSPFITAAFFLPWAGVFLAAKPNFAAPILAGARAWRQFATLLAAGTLIGLVSLLWDPSWPLEWIRVIRSMEFLSAPVVNRGGFLLLLSLLRWRRPEARVFAVLVCMPQTPSLYDLLPLVVITRTLREVIVLSLCTTFLFLAIVVLGPFPTFNDYVHMLERWAVFVVYLPVLVMILRRPNVADDPVPTAKPHAVATGGLRASIEALPRLDAILLALAAASASMLFWVTLVTNRQ